jgi:hypothetical protein
MTAGDEGAQFELLRPGRLSSTWLVGSEAMVGHD